MDKYQVLSQYFGYSEFRHGQEQLIDGILSGQDVFGIMPTGGGKSLCYQVPALLLEGVTVVVSPLISLMKDQVMALQNAGGPAVFINSSLTGEEMRRAYGDLRLGVYKLVYVAPERLLTDGFLDALSGLRVSLVAVDEAHCISQWGQDFRPGYLRIVDFLHCLGYRPTVAAFTATATLQVREDVERILQLREPLRVVTGFDRPNLCFEVRRPKNKPAEILQLVTQRAGKSGIVYCATRKRVEDVCDLLRAKGVAATRYHAGLEESERRQNQEAFIYDRCSVMVATNAFGMGIDKSNVSFVIHYNMPQSMEAYYQEAGRAGRDGAPAECILLYNGGDVSTGKYFIEQPIENDPLLPEERQWMKERDYARLEVMVGYCKTDRCLRGYILDYFGQAHEEECDNCGSCQADMVDKDITTEAKMVLSCIKRIQNHLGYSMGTAMVVRVLRGSQEQRLLSLGLQKLSTYGLMSSRSKADVESIIEALELQGYLHRDSVHGAITLTARAGEVLFREEQVTMKVPKPKETPAKKKPASTSAAEPDAELLGALKVLRFRLAREQNVPAYIVFSNATLQDMAAKAPTTMEEFLEVSGVGEFKAQQYGDVFLREIRDYLSKL